jgi:hypothetical protein
LTLHNKGPPYFADRLTALTADRQRTKITNPNLLTADRLTVSSPQNRGAPFSLTNRTLTVSALKITNPNLLTPTN